jgi:N-formylglutamate amidohydrolase
MVLYQLHAGDSPVLIDVPHAGTFLPAEIAARLTPLARTVPDTDWYVDKLYAFARAAGATLMMATHSRIVVDVNRDPSGAALYPGADNTELCPTRTFGNEPIYHDAVPGSAEIAARRSRYFDPYHVALSGEIERIRARHGHAVVLDGHSICAEVPRFFAGRLPDLNLGTAGGASCAADLQAVAAGILASAAGFTHVVNGRFKGGYVTRRYGQPERAVHALQLELAQCVYMDEAPPYRWDALRAAPVGDVLARLVDALSGWRPAMTSTSPQGTPTPL